MDNQELDQFQRAVSKYLIRHRSILDVLTKSQESSARLNRAVVKSVTDCGCITVQADRQQFPHDVPLERLGEHIGSHVGGDLCGECREVIESEMGRALFYIAALCSTLELDLEEIVEKEYHRLNALGMFNLT